MGKTLLKNAFVVDVLRDGTQADILIEDDKILDVAPTIEAEDAAIIDLSGYTVIPGIVNAHVHTKHFGFQDTGNKKLQAMCEAGVCAVLDLGDLDSLPLEDIVRWRDELDTSKCPDVIMAGKVISNEGGYGSFGPWNQRAFGLVAKDKEEAVRFVDLILDAGFDGIKIGIDAAIGKTFMQRDMIEAICNRARERGVWIGGHANEAAHMKCLVDGGITIAAHACRDILPDEDIEVMVEKGVSMTSTIVKYGHNAEMFHTPADAVPNALNNVVRFYRAGGLVAVGNDFMFPDEKYLIPVEEMAVLHTGGFSIQEIIIAATYNGAKIVRKDHLIGSIDIGKYANLIAVKGELEATFKCLLNPALVMYKGKILSRQ